MQKTHQNQVKKITNLQGVAFQTGPQENTWDFCFCKNIALIEDICDLNLTFTL